MLLYFLSYKKNGEFQICISIDFADRISQLNKKRKTPKITILHKISFKVSSTKVSYNKELIQIQQFVGDVSITVVGFILYLELAK